MNFNSIKVWTIGLSAAAILAFVLLFNSIVGFNTSGHWQFVQTLGGSTKVVLQEGPYYKGMGANFDYSDFLTYDFTGPEGRCEIERGDGLKVQYQDGGYGVVCGQLRFPLITDKASMISLHKQFKSEEGIRTKLIDKFTRKVTNMTAGLMTSTDAYSTKRQEFERMIDDQFDNGPYLTTIDTVEVVVAVDDKGVEETQSREVAVVKKEGGVVQYNRNHLSDLGILNVDVNITGFDFEDKTLIQIGNRRDAQNRAMTAKDQAKAAYWEKEQSIAEGEKNVAEADYRERVIAQKAIVAAERDKTLALIVATKKTAQAKEMTLAAKEETARRAQLAKAAVEQGKAIKTLAKAEAYARKVKIESDGGFKLQLENDLAIAKEYALGIRGMKMPDTMIVNNGTSGGSDNSLHQLLQFQVLESAKKAAAARNSLK